MSFGFMGIQFGFALQNSNVSRIFQTLGAKMDDLPILWIAAPLTGLLVQPIIGYLSDRTWHPKFGRRRPYFLLGAILATLSLCIIPNSPALWVAVAMLWIMDTSFNISMEPFRAFVGDKLPDEQRTAGFAMQSFFIGVGAVAGSILPYVFANYLHISNEAPEGVIPPSVRYSFYVGAVSFLIAVLWTVFASTEYPPDDREEFEKSKSVWVGKMFTDIFAGLAQMPKTMQQLAIVQFFSWFALFAMWIYTTGAVTQHIYGTTDTGSALYNEGANWVGICFAVYNGVAAIVAWIIPPLARYTNRRIAHLICLVLGGLGLLSIGLIKDPQLLVVSMVGVGAAWASILAMPYAILTGSLPAERMGYFMGVFNFFIVIPQIVAASILGFLVGRFFNNDPVYALVIGGASMILAGFLTLLVEDKAETAKTI
ncbi:MFS transporter [Sphingobacteriales bacterium UPWRP_1]|nr:MFS transporter [Sphingobacteriales bacterium TSM_CSM]PSJ77454.1 MFS transporter [Sphingobacteriales bacterium UPWRP_1]